ncbi:MAG: glycosyltransferase [Pseudomonas sp.]|uniref:glycosyltransferase family 32 protein n=1 Tax=Pseudomonas sp. TaxID=306 RepID=UPI00299F52A1|nr:glycosyltransferase [Pseudomonas sp.]MDX1722082.1 glycosyltransferase [Pseudomonas sp.]
MIARKIHYCWFGGRPLPLQARRCLASWAYHLPDYEIVRWDESNFDPAHHPFTSAAYAAGLYAFVSDYARMSILQAHGGIYLDVDVEVCGRFDALLDLDLFIGLEDRQRFATSIIGVTAEHWLPSLMLEYYERTPFNEAGLSELVNVNEVSRLLLAQGFSGSGEDERRGTEQVLAIGRLSDARGQAPGTIRPLARHLYAGSWRKRRGKSPLSNAWHALRKLPERLAAIAGLYAYRLGAVWRKLTQWQG